MADISNHHAGGENASMDNGELQRADDNIENEIDEEDIGNILGDVPDDNFADNLSPQQNPLLWVQTQIARCVDPTSILRELVPNVNLSENVPEMSLWKFIFEIITEPAPRRPLPHVTSLDSVVGLIRDCKNIVVLTGAGVSVSCGIPDFRSRDGIYARLSKDFPDLPDPQSMFDIKFFHGNPNPFFRFAKEIYPGSFKPSLSHRFISYLESSGKLLRNYTQNIDTLERVAGINNVVYCHGSFATASCMNCKLKVKADDVREDIFAQRIPYCKSCTVTTEGAMNILKPDIVFFGEGLSDEFHTKVKTDKEQADLLIVIGSSLKVRPVALIPTLLRADIPQILINREQLPHMHFDVELYGNCDDVIHHLCSQLGSEWNAVTQSHTPEPLDVQKYKYLFETAPNQAPTTSLASTEAINDVTSESVNSDDNESDSSKAKRRLSGGTDLESASKHQKTVEISPSTGVVPYLFYPPNSYIFHGAEIDCNDSDDSDDESSSDAHNESTSSHPTKELVSPQKIQKLSTSSDTEGETSSTSTDNGTKHTCSTSLRLPKFQPCTEEPSCDVAVSSTFHPEVVGPVELPVKATS